MGKKKKAGDKQGVLSDHRREGKRFIPPLLDLPVKIDNYWRDVSIPELIWLGLLVRTHGMRDGADLAVRLAKCAAEVWEGEKKKWFAKASSFAQLSPSQTAALLSDALIVERMPEYQRALASLNRWYPESPFSFMGTPADSEADLTQLKDLLIPMYDKTSVMAMKVQTTAIYIGFVTGMLFIRQGMVLGELELIGEYPNTDRSREFGASVRASIGALIQGPEGADRTWPNAFWQRGFALEPCDCPAITDE